MFALRTRTRTNTNLVVLSETVDRVAPIFISIETCKLNSLEIRYFKFWSPILPDLLYEIDRRVDKFGGVVCQKAGVYTMRFLL